MEKKIIYAAIAAIMGASIFTSCENDNINPYDYAQSGSKTDSTEISGSKDVITTSLAEYPKGSVVWTKDTTLYESVEVEEGTSLYIEPGVTITCSSSAKVPVELVVLGNLYCMGTEEKPVVITSDTQKPADWGGIICGYNSEEVVLNHTEIKYAGATPTESSISFQNKLFKTTIDGGVPAFHFCNVNGKFVMANCFLHDNYNDQTYFTGGNAVIYNCIFADNGNAADGGEAINVKSGCNMDIAYNLIYNACTNAFKLSNAGSSETVPLSELRIYNNTVVNCGWRRSKNKKGGSIWLEKGIFPTMVNNLICDCRFGMKQPASDGADVENSTLAPNYYFASTATSVEQMSAESDLVMMFDTDIKSTTAGEFDPKFLSFTQNPKMNVNAQVDDSESGAPLAYSSSYDFHLSETSPAYTSIGAKSVKQIFPGGIAFFGLKKVTFLNNADDQGYYFTCPVASYYFGAYSTK